MEWIKELVPYIVSIVTAWIAYSQAKKGFQVEIEKMRAQHKNELETLVKQHEIDIERLKQQHEMEKELKEKEYQHEIEMQKLQLIRNYEEYRASSKVSKTYLII